MDIVPSFKFRGNVEKSKTLKSRALQFYNHTINQAKLGNIPFMNRSSVLPDGSVINVTTKSGGPYSLRTGIITIVTKAVEAVQRGLVRIALADPNNSLTKAYVFNDRNLPKVENRLVIPNNTLTYLFFRHTSGSWVSSDINDCISWTGNYFQINNDQILFFTPSSITCCCIYQDNLIILANSGLLYVLDKLSFVIKRTFDFSIPFSSIDTAQLLFFNNSGNKLYKSRVLNYTGSLEVFFDEIEFIKNYEDYVIKEIPGNFPRHSVYETVPFNDGVYFGETTTLVPGKGSKNVLNVEMYDDTLYVATSEELYRRNYERHTVKSSSIGDRFELETEFANRVYKYSSKDQSFVKVSEIKSGGSSFSETVLSGLFVETVSESNVRSVNVVLGLAGVVLYSNSISRSANNIELENSNTFVLNYNGVEIVLEKELVNISLNLYNLDYKMLNNLLVICYTTFSNKPVTCIIELGDPIRFTKLDYRIDTATPVKNAFVLTKL
ncbi:hypothetical protein [Caudoviricetes sp.]|nr:hypothetical protein [Caudoviricetes sp.]